MTPQQDRASAKHHEVDSSCLPTPGCTEVAWSCSHTSHPSRSNPQRIIRLFLLSCGSTSALGQELGSVHPGYSAGIISFMTTTTTSCEVQMPSSSKKLLESQLLSKTFCRFAHFIWLLSLMDPSTEEPVESPVPAAYLQWKGSGRLFNRGKIANRAVLIFWAEGSSRCTQEVGAGLGNLYTCMHPWHRTK